MAVLKKGEPHSELFLGSNLSRNGAPDRVFRTRYLDRGPEKILWGLLALRSLSLLHLVFSPLKSRNSFRALPNLISSSSYFF